MGSVKGRLLVNYTADKDGLDAEIPEPLTAAEVVDRKGVSQVNLMRHRVSLHRKVPEILRPVTETATHRIAVVNEDGEEGMYVLRRDIDSEMGRLAGRVLHIKEHGNARFRADGFGDSRRFRVEMDGKGAFVDVDGHEAESINGSVFGSTEEVEKFQTREERSVEVSDWGLVGSRFSVRGRLQPLEASVARSTVFEDIDGGEFDSAFAGTGGGYEWRTHTGKPDVSAEPSVRKFPKI